MDSQLFKANEVRCQRRCIKKAEDGGLSSNIKMSHILMRYPSSHFRLIWHLCYNDLFIIITLYRNIKLCSEEWEGR